MTARALPSARLRFAQPESVYKGVDTQKNSMGSPNLQASRRSMLMAIALVCRRKFMRPRRSGLHVDPVVDNFQAAMSSSAKTVRSLGKAIACVLRAITCLGADSMRFPLGLRSGLCFCCRQGKARKVTEARLTCVFRALAGNIEIIQQGLFQGSIMKLKLLPDLSAAHSAVAFIVALEYWVSVRPTPA